MERTYTKTTATSHRPLEPGSEIKFGIIRDPSVIRIPLHRSGAWTVACESLCEGYQQGLKPESQYTMPVFVRAVDAESASIWQLSRCRV